MDEDPRRLRALADALDALASAKEGIVAKVRKGSDPSPADWAALREAEERVAAARRGLRAVPRPGMMGRMEAGTETRALKISKTKTAKRSPEVDALHKAGLTPKSAADLCGTSRDVLKQAWAKGSQFRPIRPEWAKTLAKHGVPESTWRKK